MTREKAIETLSIIKAYEIDNSIRGAEDREAIEMAIQALEQEHCEDAISRTEAIRVASGYCHWSNIPDELAKLPSVSTEKAGRWEKLSVGYGCSECSLCTNKHGIEFYRYCPNCGAKMEVEE